MDHSKNFLLQGYSTVSVLKEGENGITEIVKGLDKRVYVRKRLPFTGLPYRELQELDCPYLPQLYFVAEDDDETIIIEEYIHGSSLQELLDQGAAFTDDQVRRIGLQLCESLIAIHGANILHRDIKPSNIMQTNGGTIKLIDFGAARRLSAGPQDTRLLGTPGYAPPEQFGFATTDKRSDIYALGKTLQALAGKEVDKQLQHAIDKCTELDPERRLASAEEVKRLLSEKRCYHKYLAAAVAVLLLAVGAALYLHNADNAAGVTVPQDKQAQEQRSEKPVADDSAAASDDSKTDKQKAEIDTAEPNEEVIINQEAEKDASQASKPHSKDEKAAPQAPKPHSQEEKASPAPAAEVQASDVGFYSWEWIFTDKIRGNYLREMEKAQAAGAKYVQFLEATPYLVIENKSDRELQDPYLVLDFQDFEVDGQNESYWAYGRRRDIVEFYDRSALGYKRVVLRLQGTVLPHDEHSLFFLGNIYQTGNDPKVKVTLMVGDRSLLHDTVPVAIQ